MSSPSSEPVREEREYAAVVQAALWGRPFVECLHTNFSALKAGATHHNYWRKFDMLKTRRSYALDGSATESRTA